MIIALVLAIIAALLVHGFIKNHGFSNADGVEISYQTDKDTLLTLYYGYGKQQSPEFSHANSQAVLAYAGDSRIARFVHRNKSVFDSRLEIDSATRFRISKITLVNSISHSRKTLGPDQLATAFSTSDDTIQLSSSSAGLAIETTHPRSSVNFRYTLQGHNPVLLYGMTLLAGMLIWLFTLRFNPRQIPAIDDLYARESAIHSYRIELDGLRGIAALLVVLEHTWWRFAGSGATGVWIFFALSGYLLSQPFISRPERALDGHYVVNYIFRRLARILPMYFLTIVLIFGVTDNSNILLSHLLFLQADGHLWTIPQEVFFYLVLPFIMLLLCLLSRINRILLLAVLASVTCVLLFNPAIIGLELYGYGQYTPPYLGWFLIGMLIAYIGPASDAWQAKLTDKHRSWLSIFGIGLLVILLAASSSWVVQVVTGSDIVLPSKFKAIFAIMGAALMLLVLLSPGTLLSRIFSFTPLRAIGIVGYSYYLLHPLVIDGLMDFSMQYFNYPLLHGQLFVVTSFVTWLVCLFSYSLIERPFLVKKHP